MIKTDALGGASKDPEGHTFFQKMIGDYYRYMAESAQGEVLEEAKNGALDSYKESEIAGKGLNACNPIKLGLALNQSVFYYEIMQDNKQACVLAETAL